MKFPARIFGEIHGFDPAGLKELQQKDLGPFEFKNDRLVVEHEGPPLDIESYLDEIAAALDEHGRGYVDYVDHDQWRVYRYQLKPGSWTCTTVNPDHALEGYHHLQ